MATAHQESRGLQRRLHIARQRLTDHAIEQWDDRTPEDARSPEWALAHSVRDSDVVDLDHFYQEHRNRRADAVHCYRGRTGSGAVYGAAFIEINDVIVTCYTIGSVWDPALRAYLQARVDSDGGTVDE